jgi:UMF1 family MFS transporter
LPDVANEDQQDWISARGFSLGYIGSVLLLLFDLAMVMNPQWFGITDSPSDPAAVKAMRYSFVTVGIWWIVFSQYTFYYMPKGYKKEGERVHLLLNGIKELRLVYAKLSESPRLKSFLKAFFVYGMAVQTIMLVAAFYGEEKIDWGSDQMRTTGLIISMLVIQLVAILGATLTAKASSRYGNIPVLILLNVIWICICVYAFFMETPTDFYTAAGCVGMVMGGIQALSRSTYSKMLPETEDTASYFSFYDVAEKIGIVIGTFIYGAIAQITGDIKFAIIILGLFFIGGALLLTRVNKKALSLN